MTIQATRELIKQEIARRDYFSFVEYMFPVPVKWNWHHRYLASILQKFQEGYIANLMVFMPPQHQKTTFLTEYLPAWSFGKKPDEQVVLIMYDSPMSEKYNRRIQRIITDEKYQQIFPDTKLNERNVVTDAGGNYVRNSREFEIVNKNGFLRSVGIGAGIAGTPAKMALIDDIIKNVGEAQSITYRNKTYDWYTDELEARLHNDSRVAFTITRRHEDDLAGRLILRDGLVEEGGKWTVIKLPAIKEDNSNPDDIRQIGEALFPELHSLERMQEVRDKSPRTFSSMYQQRPAPEEGIKIMAEWFEIVERSALPDSFVADMYVDGAYTKNTKNDPTGLMPCYYHNNSGTLYITGWYSAYLEMPELLKFIVSYAEIVNVNQSGNIRIEPKASGKSLRQLIRSETNLNATEIDGDHVNEGKEARCDACMPTMAAGRVKLLRGSWNEKFLAELKYFPNGKHDEAVDCICYAIFDKFLKKQRRMIY